MRDGIGNKLDKGAMLWWKSKELPVHILDIIEPTVQTISGQTEQPKIIVAITIPVDVPPGKEAYLGDFLCVRDPASETLMDRLEKARRQ